ncbi:toprim domain-containing protein [Burkholderia pseudomallei]|uniref:toprim domain-containing protein n=1 Tax=Burkholderia pseudomallei TaxID=28450 RepID=UPI000F077D03|nr:toprim domain-containing protein [Burkholderia pseudomallei]CAJ3079203.1 primase C 2 (PriCT-2) family [Burkholderia pseudomallei]VCK72297.1 primase C 2 (PriCT-2) family [Burkholderia pseudomallei]VCK79751.1 primase C 2 (PriCT-2) family [Burkholderia pseudomallei]VCK80259.1 primase C 2 (PriCT-2) family [Burkholderia pseudomallei]VCK80583.1 primase C 2 (PriCT-2) family [Burkholderia pseudomallei]
MSDVATSSSSVSNQPEANPDPERILRLGKPLAVPHGQGKQAYRLGARFDETERAWFAPPGSDWNALKQYEPRVEGFDRWSAIDKFEAAMMAAGLEPPALTQADLDGTWHRVPLQGKKPSNRDGAYKAELTADGLHGLIRNYVDHERPITFSERQWTDPHVFAALQAEQRQRQVERAAALREAQEAAAGKAEWLWNRGSERPQGGGLAYLLRKGLGNVGFGARFLPDKLVLAAGDIDDRVWTAQTIDRDGEKHFLKDGKKMGCMFWIGRPRDGEPIAVVEGFATGASVRRALGHVVAVAFDAGNLRPVAEAIRGRFPNSPMALLADNDREKEAQGKGNAGVQKASAAAETLDVAWLAPRFSASTAFSATDWNDLMVAEGLAAVREQCAAGLPLAFAPTQRALEGPRPVQLAPGRSTRMEQPRPRPRESERDEPAVAMSR